MSLFPQDPLAERAVLGASLQEPALAPDLHPEWFNDARCQKAAAALLALASESRPIDSATLAQRLTAGGMAEEEAKTFIRQLQEAAQSPGTFPHWREILTEKLTLRRIIRTAQQAQLRAYDSPKLENQLDAFERDVLAIRDQVIEPAEGEADLKAVLDELAADLEQARKEGKASGLPTGFPALDKLVGGMKPQQLIVLAARPSVGKSALALGIFEHLALGMGVPVGFFTLEMSKKELLNRMCCARAGVDATKVNEGKVNEQEVQALAKVRDEIQAAPLRLCERGGLAIGQLAAEARRMVQRHKVRLLAVDHLGLLRCGERGRSRYEEVTIVSNALKALAKELKVPVIALAQLNRDMEKDTRTPRLSDLRDSGAIEQDADIVLLLNRTEIETEQGQLINLIVAKHRSGPTGSTSLNFTRATTRFEELAAI